MRISKKILAAVLAALMAISMMPFTAFAAPPGSSETGTGTGGISIGGGSTVVGGDSYLTFTGTDSFSIKTNNNAKNWSGTLEYSTDTNTWTTWNGTQISSNNNVLYLRGTGNARITGSGSSSKYWVITTEGTVACSGDIRTLLDYDDPEYSSMGTYCFAHLFYNCTSLTAAPELPATMLAGNCYLTMFYGCTNLTTAPELPATSLAPSCYSNMFSGCTSLTTAPELPSTSLAQFCYADMFNGCENLTTAPVLPATSLAPYCYSKMFKGCRSLTTAPALPATSLASNCYQYMFDGCESLTTAPALPATTMERFCYQYMFNGCTSLTTPSELSATDLADYCYDSMFKGCTGIKLSTEQTAEYSIPYSIPKEGTGTMGTESLSNMFSNTGGTFTGTPTINTTYYLDAPTPVYTDGFMVGSDHFDDFEEAVAAARTGSEKTVTCLSDVDLTSYAASARHYIDITGVTIDLNDHQMDVGTHWSVCFTGTNGKIMNGTCVGHDSPAYENYAYGIYIWGPGSGNVANSGGQKATIELEDLVCNYGIHCWNADVTIKDCDVTGSNSYYAVWADENTNVTIESGNFTTNGAAVLGAAKSSDGDGNISVEGGDFVVPAGKKLAQSGTSSKPENVQVSGGTFNVVVPVINCADGYVPVTTPDPETGKYEVKEAREDGFNLTIEDKIYMNLYVNVDEYVSENATLSITYNDPDAQSPTAKTDTYSGADLAALKDSEDGRYIVSVLAAPAQMRDEVTVAVKNGTSVVHTFTTCVADYCEAIVAMYAGNETTYGHDGNLCRLGRALLDYGKACSDEFNYNEAAFASQDYYNPTADEFDNTAADILGWYAYINTDLANGKFKSYSYIAKSIPALRIYLNATEAEVLRNGLKAYVDGEEVAITVVEGTDKVCIDITGILAENLDEEYEITFNGGTLNINALQYAKAKGGTTDFGRSMTFYWDAARNFFEDAH